MLVACLENGESLVDLLTSFALPDLSCLRVDLYPRVTFPDFITSANRELIPSAFFLPGSLSALVVQLVLWQ